MILPPYSPFLNPVEQAISCLKANLKADIARPHVQNRMCDRNAARNAQLPLGEYRKQLLIAATERNMASNYRGKMCFSNAKLVLVNILCYVNDVHLPY